MKEGRRRTWGCWVLRWEDTGGARLGEEEAALAALLTLKLLAGCRLLPSQGGWEDG